MFDGLAICSPPPVTKGGRSIPRRRPGEAEDEAEAGPGPAADIGAEDALLPGLCSPPSIATAAARLGRVKSALPFPCCKDYRRRILNPLELSWSASSLDRPSRSQLLIAILALGGPQCTDGHRESPTAADDGRDAGTVTDRLRTTPQAWAAGCRPRQSGGHPPAHPHPTIVCPSWFSPTVPSVRRSPPATS